VPYAIYEILPYLYLAIGAGAALVIDSIFGQVCGVMLMMLGLAILKMRIEHRRSYPSSKTMISRGRQIH
jgi:hypothetical protein